MTELSEIYPEYKWSENKGYSCAFSPKGTCRSWTLASLHRIGFGEPAPVEEMDVVPLLPLFGEAIAGAGDGHRSADSSYSASRLARDSR